MIINICDTTILCRNNKSHNEFRTEVKFWLRTNFLNSIWMNTETGYEIFINNTFIEKVTNKFVDVKAHSFTEIPNIIKNAVFVSAEDDDRNRPDIIKVLKFESLIQVDNIQYEVWIYVRQTRTQLNLYSLN